MKFTIIMYNFSKLMTLAKIGYNFLCNFIFDEDFRFKFLAYNTKFYDNLADEKYLKRIYKANFGVNLNLDNPKKFSEKLQFLKLYDRKPEYTKMVDKYEVKKLIENRLGASYLIPLIGVWDKPTDIDFEKLPNQFVLKCNHNSGVGMTICKDKKNLDIKKTIYELNIGLNQDYFIKGREWPYKNVKRKIIAEKYLEDREVKELRDYKFFCFNGIVKIFKIDYDRFTEHHAIYYNRESQIINLEEKIYPPSSDANIKVPDSIGDMIELAETLAKGTHFLRVDFYFVDGKIFFGELTFFPDSGFGEFNSQEWDYTLGSWIEL